MGADRFAERALRLLLAVGEHTRKRAVENVGQRTVRTQIARFAVEGHTNAEIGAEPVISAPTLEYHLRKVLAKLGIHSRNKLDRVFPM